MGTEASIIIICRESEPFFCTSKSIHVKTVTLDIFSGASTKPFHQLINSSNKTHRNRWNTNICFLIWVEVSIRKRDYEHTVCVQTYRLFLMDASVNGSHLIHNLSSSGQKYAAFYLNPLSSRFCLVQTNVTAISTVFECWNSHMTCWLLQMN